MEKMKVGMLTLCIALSIVVGLFFGFIAYHNYSMKEKVKLEEKLNSILSIAEHDDTINPWVLIDIISGEEEK